MMKLCPCIYMPNTHTYKHKHTIIHSLHVSVQYARVRACCSFLVCVVGRARVVILCANRDGKYKIDILLLAYDYKNTSVHSRIW